MKKTKSLIFTIALLAMVLSASMAFATDETFLYSTGSGFGFFKLSGDANEIVTKEGTADVIDVKGAKFLPDSDSQAYAATDSKLYTIKITEGKVVESEATTTSIDLGTTGGVQTIALLNSNYFAVGGKSKGYIFKSGDISTAVISKDSAAGITFGLIKSSDVDEGLLVVDDTKVKALASKDLTVYASADIAAKGAFAFNLGTLAGSFDVFTAAGIGMYHVSNDTTNEVWTLSIDKPAASHDAKVAVVFSDGTNALVYTAGKTLYKWNGTGTTDSLSDDIAITDSDSKLSDAPTAFEHVGGNFYALIDATNLVLLSVDIEGKKATVVGVVEGATAAVKLAAEGVDFSPVDDGKKENTEVKVEAGKAEAVTASAIESMKTANEGLYNALTTALGGDTSSIVEATNVDSTDASLANLSGDKADDRINDVVSNDTSYSGRKFTNILTFGGVKPSATGKVVQKISMPKTSETTFDLTKFVFFFIKMTAINNAKVDDTDSTESGSETGDIAAVLAADSSVVKATVVGADGKALSGTLTASSEDFYVVPESDLEKDETYAMVAGELTAAENGGGSSSSALSVADINSVPKSADIVKVLGETFLTAAECGSSDANYKSNEQTSLTEAISDDLGYAIKNAVFVKTFTPTKDGALLLSTDISGYSNLADLEAGELVVVFANATTVLTASILAADNGTIEANLWDANGVELEDDTNYKQFYSGAKLTSGTQYAFVIAQKASTSNNTTNVSKSSSGCDAGFGIWSLAALLAISKLSKRR